MQTIVTKPLAFSRTQFELVASFALSSGWLIIHSVTTMCCDRKAVELRLKQRPQYAGEI